jgi:hypothetical protein
MFLYSISIFCIIISRDVLLNRKQNVCTLTENRERKLQKTIKAKTRCSNNNNKAIQQRRFGVILLKSERFIEVAFTPL